MICHIHNDGNPKGAQRLGEFGSEKIALPMVAKGPNPTKNQINVRTHANLTFFF